MDMRTDSIFRIGTSHRVCQDYAMHGNNFIIVSDGCSSSPNTDLGSRFLCLAARKFMYKSLVTEESYDLFGKLVINEAKSTTEELFLSDRCLDATLLVAFCDETKIVVLAYGDGVILVEKKDGTIEVIKLVFESGAPFYLSYKLEADAESRYLGHFKGDLLINERRILPNGQLSWTFNVEEIRSISLCSDGFDSFLKDDRETFQLDVKELLGFKNIMGSFLDRRLDKYLVKQLFKKEQIDHYDDFSMATMLFVGD